MSHSIEDYPKIVDEIFSKLKPLGVGKEPLPDSEYGVSKFHAVYNLQGQQRPMVVAVIYFHVVLSEQGSSLRVRYRMLSTFRTDGNRDHRNYTDADELYDVIKAGIKKADANACSKAGLHDKAEMISLGMKADGLEIGDMDINYNKLANPVIPLSNGGSPCASIKLHDIYTASINIDKVPVSALPWIAKELKAIVGVTNND